MKRRIPLFFAIIACLALTPQVTQSAEMTAWQEGETWVYSHDGPRPWRGRDEVVAGDRVMKVLQVRESGSKTWWTLNDAWGDYDNSPNTYFVDKDRKAASQQTGDTSLRFEPAMPLDFSGLKPGEERSLSLKAVVGDGSYPIKMEVKRLNDETIAVPAGEFKNCIKIETVTDIMFGPVPVKSTRTLWYHPGVNGMVKEKTTFADIKTENNLIEGYTAVSELKEYKKPE